MRLRYTKQCSVIKIELCWSCLVLLAGFGLLGRDGGVDALPAIGCYRNSNGNFLSVPSGSADCAEVASAIEKLPGVTADVKCVRKRLWFGLSLVRVGESGIGRQQ